MCFGSTPQDTKTTTLYADFHHHSHYHNPLQSSQVFTELPTYHDHHFPQIIFFLLPCILKFWVKGVQNKNIFDWRIHYPQCLSNLEAIGRKHFVKALPSKYSSSSTLRIFFSANILNHLPSKYSPLSSEYSFLLRKPWCFYISR